MKRFLTFCLLLAVLLAAVLAWLAGSVAGNRRLMDLCSRLTPLQLQGEVLRPLTRGFMATGLRVGWPAGEIRAARLTLDWLPLDMAARCLCIERFAVDDLEITLAGVSPDRAEEKKKPAFPALPELPLVIELRQLALSNLTFDDGGDQPLHLSSVRGSFRFAGGRLGVERVEVAGDFGRVAGRADLDRREGLRAALGWHWPTPVLGLDRGGLALALHSIEEGIAGPLHLVAGDGEAARFDLSGALHGSAAAIDLRELLLRRRGADDRVSGLCRIEFNGQGPAVEADLALAAVNLLAESGWATDLNGTVRGTYGEEGYRAEVDLRNDLPDWRQAGLRTTVTGGLQGLRLQGIEAELLHGTATGELAVSWDRAVQISGRLTGRELDLSLVEKRLQGTFNLTAEAELIAAEGDRGPVARWNIDFDDSVLQDHHFAGTFVGGWQEDDLTITDLDLQGEGIHLSGKGRLSRRVEVELAVQDLGRIVSGFRGEIAVAGWIAGSGDEVRGEGSGEFSTIGFADLSVAGGRLDLAWPGGGRAGRAELALQQVSKGDITLQTLQVNAAGRPSRHTLAAEVGWDGGDLRIEGGGGWNKDRWQGEMQRFAGTERTSGGWRLLGPVAVSGGGGRLALGDFLLEGERGWRLKGRAEIDPGRDRYDAELVWSDLALSLLQPLTDAVQLAGSSNGAVSLRSEGAERLTFTVDAAAQPLLTVGGRKVAFSTATVAGKWTDGGLAVDALLRPEFGGRLTAALRSPEPGRLGLPGRFDLSLDWKNLPVEKLPIPSPPEAEVSGRWQGSLQLSWPGPDLPFTVGGRSWIEEGELLWESKEGEVSASLRKAEARIDWRDETAGAAIDILLAEEGRLQGRLSVVLPARWPVSLRNDLPLDGDFSFAFGEFGVATVLFPGMVDEVRGKLSGEIAVGGVLALPSLSGRFALEKAGGVVPDAGLRIEDLELQGRFTENRLTLEELRLKSGGGELVGSGSLALAGWLPERWSFDVKGDRVLLVDLPEWTMRISPDLHLAGNAAGTKVTGVIAVPEMLLTGIESPPVAASPDVVLVGEAEKENGRGGGPELAVDAKITLGDSVVVKAQGLDARLEGEVTVRSDDKGRYTGQGEIRIAKGQYAAYGLRLPISRGRLIFAGGPVEEPLIDVLAERSVGEVKAGMQIGGTPRNPRMKLVSTPAMPDTDILSYLVLGRPIGKSAGQEGALMMAASALMARGESAALQEQLKRHLGIDVLQVENGGGTVEESMVTIGKYLTPDLYLSFGQSLFSPVSLATLRYRMTDRWELESQVGTVSGVDLSYRLEFW
ncbi:MAG: translocation/assembly module TamB domain-containing protein [Thermodesulfobacteriota bacterium]